MKSHNFALPGLTDRLVLGCLVAVLLSGNSYSREEPEWEFGAGLAFADVPHYLGADEGETYLLPVPYFVYRGKYLRADRSGVRGVLYDSEKLDLRLSMGGSPPVDSHDNDARDDMDDLDAVFEIGPTLQYQLHKGNGHLWRLDLPVRTAFTLGTGSDFMDYTGWTTNPRLYYRREWTHWTATGSFGPVFSDRRYHAYIYDVAPRFATDERPEYKAGGGYTGTRTSFSLRRRVGDWFIGAFMGYQYLNGADNEDSPLFKQDDYLTVGLAVAWVFSESKTMVNVTEN
jgi:outer membrane protein